MVPTLLEITLSALSPRFEQFCAEFNMESSIPRKHKEFLKRCYSEEIFNSLKKEQKLKMEYLDILINQHIKELDIQNIDRSLLPHLLDKLQGNGEAVLSLKASSSDLKGVSCESLMSALPNLKSISFNNWVSAEICEAIGKNCPLLQVMEIYHGNDNDERWHYRDEEEEEDAIRFVLEGCPYLETLRHADSVGILYTLYTRGMLSECRTLLLKSLSSECADYPLDSALEVCATSCPYVTDLEIDYLEGDEEVEKILYFKFLSNLKIKKISNVTMNCFEKFLKLSGSNLLSLVMPYTSCLSVVNLIECCPKLQCLKLHDGENRAASQTHQVQSCIASLSDLKSLHFLSFDFNISATAHDLRLLLSAAKRLRKLALNRCSGLTSDFIRSLNLKHIYELEVGWSDIRPEHLDELVLCGSLQRLTVESCWKVCKSEWNPSKTNCRKLLERM